MVNGVIKLKIEDLRYYFYINLFLYKFICIFFVYCRENVGVLI